MTTTINADDGVVSGSAGLKYSSDSSGELALQTNGTTAVTVDASQNTTFAGTVADPTGTLRPLVSGTVVASTSGTSIDFTGIPSWVKRITVMFSGVSTNGSSILQVQLGDSGGIETTSYVSNGYTSNTNNSSSTTGFLLGGGSTSTYVRNGVAQICAMGSNLWCFSYSGGVSVAGGGEAAGGTKTLSDTLDRIRITTVNGTDTFDAGSINILYEG